MLGKRIKELRVEKGLTLKKLGEKLNLGESTMSMYESGNRNPDYDTLSKIAEIFNVSTDYLLGRTDQRKPEKYEPETIAAHHDGDEWTEEELEDIERFKEFVKMRREKK